MINPKEVKVGDEFIFTINNSYGLKNIYELKLTRNYKNGMYKFFWRNLIEVSKGTFTANEDIFSSKDYYKNTTLVRKDFKELVNVDDPEFKELYV